MDINKLFLFKFMAGCSHSFVFVISQYADFAKLGPILDRWQASSLMELANRKGSEFARNDEPYQNHIPF